MLQNKLDQNGALVLKILPFLRTVLLFVQGNSYVSVRYYKNGHSCSNNVKARKVPSVKVVLAKQLFSVGNCLVSIVRVTFRPFNLLHLYTVLFIIKVRE